MSQEIDICKEIEPILRAIGLHVGITGSRVYGMGKKQAPDIDIIIYPHAQACNGRVAVETQKIVDCLKPIFPMITELPCRYTHTVLRAFYQTVQVDFLLIP